MSQGEFEDPIEKRNQIIIIVVVIIIVVCILVLIWLLVHLKHRNTECTSSDYYENPSDAIRSGAKVSDILSVDNGVMKYKRYQNKDCTPGSDQTVTITYPQYCKFTASANPSAGTQDPVTYRDLYFNGNLYINESGTIVTTTGNCVPKNTDLTGEIINNWT